MSRNLSELKHLISFFMQSNEITLVMVSENVLEAYSLCNTSQYLRFNRVSYDA